MGASEAGAAAVIVCEERKINFLPNTKGEKRTLGNVYVRKRWVARGHKPEVYHKNTRIVDEKLL